MTIPVIYILSMVHSLYKDRSELDKELVALRALKRKGLPTWV